jgi:hypothetical protein
MELRTLVWRRLLLTTSFIVLLLGLGVAFYIFQTADDDPNEVLGYEIINGKVYSKTLRNN